MLLAKYFVTQLSPLPKSLSQAWERDFESSGSPAPILGVGVGGRALPVRSRGGSLASRSFVNGISLISQPLMGVGFHFVTPNLRLLKFYKQRLGVVSGALQPKSLTWVNFANF
jgi:hypothetical protein